MATILASASISQLAPLFGLGVVGFWVASREAHKTEEDSKRKPSREEERNRELAFELEHQGHSEATFSVLHDHLELYGAPLNERIIIEPHDDSWKTDPNIDPIAAFITPAHVALNNADRWRLHYILSRSESDVRPRRAVPISMALSKEISRPNDPSAVSDIQGWKIMPNYANATQVKKAVQVLKDPSLRQDQVLQKYYDGEFFSRAPGQSFRYE